MPEKPSIIESYQHPTEQRWALNDYILKLEVRLDALEKRVDRIIDKIDAVIGETK